MEAQQTLLVAATGIVLVGTVIALVWQWWRSRGRD
jgi:hypothetical protein